LVLSADDPRRAEIPRSHATRRAEWPIVVVLFASAVTAGTYSFDRFVARGGVPFFYQVTFAPAVSVACGLGYRNLTGILSLEEFLTLKRDRFDCADLPPHPQSFPLGSLERTSPYLELAVALVWKVSGVSWPAVRWLCAALFGLIVVLCYGIFRLWAGRLTAFAVSLLVLGSPLHHENLPHLRDFAKAPFLLATILAMGWLALRVRERRELFAAAAFGGAAVGIGLGFRPDVLLAVVPFIVTVLTLVARPIRLVNRIAALSVFLATTLVLGMPAWLGYSKGGNTGHVAILGLTTPFDASLGLSRPMYDVGHEYLDSYVFTVVRAEAARTDATAPINLAAAQYETACYRYIGHVMRLFPADMAIRAVAATLRVLALPQDDYGDPPFPLPGERFRTAYRVLVGAMLPSVRSAPIWLALAMIVAAFRGWRVALWVLLIVVWFAGGAALQFMERHYFYLEFLPLSMVGVVLAQVAAVAKWGVAHPQGFRDGSVVRTGIVAVRPAVLFVALLSAVIVAGIGAIRVVQRRALLTVLTGYRTLPGERLPVEHSDLGNGWHRLMVSSLRPDAARSGADSRAEYVSIVLARTSACDTPVFPITVQYNSAPSRDLSRTFSARTSAEAGYESRLMFPVFLSEPFEGFDLPTRSVGCIEGIYRLKTSPRRPPLFLNLAFVSGWERGTLFQVLREFESVGADDSFPRATQYVGLTPDVNPSLEQSQPFPTEERVAYVAPTAAFTEAGQLTVSGRAPFAHSYLLTTKPVRMRTTTHVIVEGLISVGGLTIGLLRNDRWAEVTDVVEVGPFRLIMRAPGDGDYALVLANNLGGRWVNRFTASIRLLP
jgi:hypothetical protein